MKATMIEDRNEGGFKLTGGYVLLALIGFFLTVMVVNGVMAYLAVETFSGVQSEKPYETGLAFNRDIARAKAQDALGWTVDEKVTRSAAGDVSVNVNILDSSRKGVTGLTVTSNLKAPVNSHNDCRLALSEQSGGLYTGTTLCGAGQWDVETVAQQNGDIVYRSTNRIILH